MKKFLRSKIAALAIVIGGFVTIAHAQVTTSSVTGMIKDAKGGALPGAGIKAIHTPTGTVYSILTNADGRFVIGGMRVGGPYTIEVSFVGFKPQKIGDLYLKLGEPFSLNLRLEDNSSTLSEVKVVGNKSAVFNANKSGTSTVVTRTQIQNLPTVSRNINDLTRLTPQAANSINPTSNGVTNTGMSIGGGNYRSSNFSVDGANFNNQFGIGSNLPAAGSPISIDALEQISINVTPYDVRQTGFTGGAINAVTRSGTNKFTGSAFYTYRSDDLQGRKVGDYIIPISSLLEQNYGATLGGPIIKDKLFFFANVEFKKATTPGTTKVAATTAAPFGSANYIAKPTDLFLNEVKNYLTSKYGYDPGEYQGYSNKFNNDKIFVRLDWNINKNHRFSVRYNQVESKTPNTLSSSTTGSNFSISTANNRLSINALPFSNSNYYQAANLYTGVAELNSTFLNRFTNTLRATYSHQNDPRASDSALFPLVDILDGVNSGTTNTTGTAVKTTFGYEPFTYGNLRDVKSYTYTDDLGIALGKHNVSVGLQAEFSTTKNGFQRFGTGYYTFNSWDDFVNNAKPTNYAVTYSLNADGSQAYPTFKFAQYSAYAQDEFTVNDRLKLTAGLRLELATFPGVSEVRTHPLVSALTFADGRKVDTGVLPSSNITFSPRFGFNWDVKGDRSIQVRGGSGIFTGRVPFVWIVAQSGDAGLLQYTQTYNGAANTPLFNPSIKPNLTSVAPPAGSSIPSNISAMSPNLKFPQTWKSSLAVDIKLPYGIVGTLEGIYGRDLNAAVAKNVNLVEPEPLNITGYPDNRPFYPTPAINAYINQLKNGLVVPKGTSGAGQFNTIVMENAKGGYNWSATAQLSKQFSQGVSVMVAYTHSEQRNYSDGSGDQLFNLWSIPSTSSNPNHPTLSYSSNLNPDRIIGLLSYKKEWLKSLATSVSLFYEGTQQGRFSYIYSADFNRDGQPNDLIYIPKDASEITFAPIPANTAGYRAAGYTAQEQSDIFMAYINQDKYLSKHKGQYAERNGAVMPWRHQFDFKFTQELFKNIGGYKNALQFTVDIFNVGNLLNKNWGTYNYVNNNGSILVPRNVSAINTTTKPTFWLANSQGDIIRNTFSDVQTTSSTYYMQFGIRYIFN